MVTRPDPAPGRTLHAFVAAGQRGDTDGLWALLSRPSRAGLGGSPARFGREVGRTFVRSLRPVRPGARTVLSQRIGRAWAVAAVAGTRAQPDGVEDFAFAVALRREPGGWRVEHGGVLVGGVRPEPLEEEAASGVLLRADAAGSGHVRTMLLWLDGQPVAARTESETPFSARVRADIPTVRPGPHVGVAFAATAEGAGAVGWPFSVAR